MDVVDDLENAMMASSSQDVRDALSSMIPLGRMGRPDVVAAAALCLASNESSFTTVRNWSSTAAWRRFDATPEGQHIDDNLRHRRYNASYLA